MLVSQACGSSDKSTKPRVERPEGGAAGADSGAENGGARDHTPTGGTAGTAGTVGDGGSPTAGSGGAGGEGGAAGNATGGGQGGANEGGATGEGGIGGTGEEVTCEVAPTCSQDLSNVGTGDFSISFKITTNAQRWCAARRANLPQIRHYLRVRRRRPAFSGVEPEQSRNAPPLGQQDHRLHLVREESPRWHARERVRRRALVTGELGEAGVNSCKEQSA